MTADPTLDGGSTGVKTPELLKEEFSGYHHHRNPTLPGFGFRVLRTRWTIQLLDVREVNLLTLPLILLLLNRSRLRLSPFPQHLENLIG